MKKAINKTTNEEHKCLVNSRILNETQMQLVTDMIAHYDNRTLLRRSELKSAHFALRNRLASPYFIAKNVAVKAANNMYDLSRFKLAKSSTRAIETSAVETNDEAQSVAVAVVKVKRTKKIKAITASDSAQLDAMRSEARNEETNDEAQLDALDALETQ